MAELKTRVYELGAAGPIVRHYLRHRQEVMSEEAAPIIAYLENPVATGLWRLAATWHRSGGISDAIWQEIDKEIGTNESIQIKSGKRDRKIRVTEEWKQEIREQVSGRISFLLTLFQFLAQQASGQPESDEAIAAEIEQEQLVLDLIDTSKIGSMYAEALKYFQDNLFRPSFLPVARVHAITRLKVGPFILIAGPRDGDSLVMISWVREPVDAMRILLEKLGKITDAELMPVFSPEEEAFAPYLDLLGMVREYLVKQEHLRPLISKALTNFNEGNFTDCVSALGLAGEDVLTQVFETLFREQMTRGLTLGQLVDEINTRSAQFFPKRDEPAPDLSQLFTTINEAIDSNDHDSKHALEIMRQLLTQVIASNRHLLGRLDKVGRVERRVSIFPDKVADLLTELIRYRNAASHKSRVPIGPYECRRSAYAFVVLYSWWAREKNAIDWRMQPREIVVDCVRRNSDQ
jgi:hypothetical protein